MSPRVRGTLVAAGVLALMVTASGVLAARDRRYDLPDPPERLLYLRSGPVAHGLALSFDALAADVYWIRVVQHYGGDRLSGRSTGRFELLQPLLDLTTTLDPRFVIAYRFGAIFLGEPAPGGPNRPDQAIDLLKKGLAADPTHWQYDYDIGFVYLWHYRDPRSASEWFARGAALPGAPNWLRPFSIDTLADADRAAARPYLQELMRTNSDAWIRKTAERRLAQLDAMDALDELQAIVDEYARTHHVFPDGWAALVNAGRLRGVPLDPTRTPYDYDATAHRVRLSVHSPLFPLPARPWEK